MCNLFVIESSTTKTDFKPDIFRLSVYGRGARYNRTNFLYLDFKTAGAVSLKSLMQPDSDYVLIFNKIINNEKMNRELHILNSFENIKDNQDYYLSNEGVNVYFQQYEYFPYAAGIQSFTADYAVLKDMLDTKYVFLDNDTKMLNTEETNVLNIGQDGKIVLKGNPSTGYTWNYEIEDNSIVKLDAESLIQESNIIGAASTYIWEFKG
jgi:inhibitor of cysteine peptidase